MNKLKIPSLKRRKRALFLPFRKSKGSMALEGSLVLPIFLFFMMTVFLGLEAVRFQSNVLEALHQAGNAAAFEGDSEGYIGEGSPGAKARVQEYLDSQLSPYLCVSGGREGVTLQEFSQGSGQIELLAEYGFKPFISWLPIGEIKVNDRFFTHSWIGYTGGEGQSNGAKEVYVYITKTGSRYHLSYHCTYLNPRPTAVSYEEAGLLRNASGGKYYPCQRCRPVKGGIVYFTQEGRAYHGKSDCPALKRTVYMIPLSEAVGYGACNKCGG